ncbi:translation termination factor GTPase eRF3 [Binucleata daphniae]
MVKEDINDVTASLQNIKINKQIISIVFIGHVDAGKSTTAGQILNILDLIDKRTLEKYKEESAQANRESWYLSWALDTNPEERERGKTTEVGKCVFETKNKKIFILDAPGHKMYVSDMIVGANQADIAVLVVSSRINEFEAGIKGGQTHEHILLARASNIRKIIVLVNKMDDPSVMWSETRYLEILQHLDIVLRKIYAKEDITYVPVSGYLGTNIKKVDNKVCEWYKGESFLDYLDNLKFERKENDSLVFCVTEKIKNMGVLLGGKIESGRIERGMEVYILPSKQKTTILAIYDDEDVEIAFAIVGDNVKIKIKDFADDINEGTIICDAVKSNYKVSTVFTCMLSILQTKHVISAGYMGVLHLKSAQKDCKILEIRQEVNGVMKRKIQAGKGEKVLCKIQVDTPLVLYAGEDKMKKNWFAIRDEGFTVAIGVVRNILDK